jgi:glutamyl-tRNA reductase
MLGLIGIRKNIDIKIREKFNISDKKRVVALGLLSNIFEDVVILSTCNRTEIYFNNSLGEEGLKKVFHILDWEDRLMEYTFYIEGNDAQKHLFEVICGFHSKILGEDQILGQIKDAYEISLQLKVVKVNFQKLFEEAIGCGKKFRSESKLYEIPVSSSSIAVNTAINLGAKNFMIMGYGTIGKLVVKYALASELDNIKLVVRDKQKVEEIEDNRFNIMEYDESRDYLNEMDAVISCTSAPHFLIHRKDIDKQGKRIILMDLALPRDIDYSLKDYGRVLLYDIDDISKLDDENKKLRLDKMKTNKYIIDEHLSQYREWLQTREVSNYIKCFKEVESTVVNDRVESFKNKSKSEKDLELAEVLIKSTADYYVNKAIKVLKEEKLKGREEECMRILKEIFMEK